MSCSRIRRAPAATASPLMRAPSASTPPPGAKSRTLAALVAHLHNCGLRDLERTAPEAQVPGELDRARVTPAQAARALGAKGRAVVRIVGAALADGSRIVGYPHSAAQ